MRFILAIVFSFIFSASFAQQSTLESLDSINNGRDLSSVGRLSFDNGAGFCTATLIEPDLILTAAHCLFDAQTGREFDIDGFEFQAGFRNGRAEAYRKIREARADPDYRFDTKVTIERIKHDIALMRLQTPIKNPLIPPLAISSLPATGEIVGVISYARGRMNAPSVQNTCRVTARQDGVLIMNCDVDFGASGSPVFVIGPDGITVVSVVSAMAELGGKKVSLGTSLLDAITEIKARLYPTDELNGNSTRRRDTGAKFARP